MSINHQHVFSQALALPPEVREELAEALWFSLDHSDGDEIRKAWAEEIEKRVTALEKGEATLIPADEVMRSIKEEILKK